MVVSLANLQIYTKSICALVLALLVWANQRFGIALPVDNDTIALIAGLIVTAGVALAPANKPTITQSAQIVVDAKTDSAVTAKVVEIQAADKIQAKADAATAKADAIQAKVDAKKSGA